MKQYYVYILTNKKKGTLYVGVTSNLKRRTYQHKHNSVKGFTQRYNVHLLVYFEIYTEAKTAIAREKQLKWWKRSWKIDLIEKENPEWKDLYETIT